MSKSYLTKRKYLFDAEARLHYPALKAFLARQERVEADTPVTSRAPRRLRFLSR